MSTPKKSLAPKRAAAKKSTKSTKSAERTAHAPEAAPAKKTARAKASAAKPAPAAAKKARAAAKPAKAPAKKTARARVAAVEPEAERAAPRSRRSTRAPRAAETEAPELPEITKPAALPAVPVADTPDVAAAHAHEAHEAHAAPPTRAASLETETMHEDRFVRGPASRRPRVDAEASASNHPLIQSHAIVADERDLRRPSFESEPTEPDERDERDAEAPRDPETAGFESPRRRKVRRAASSADAWARRGVAPPPNDDASVDAEPRVEAAEPEPRTYEPPRGRDARDGRDSQSYETRTYEPPRGRDGRDGRRFDDVPSRYQTRDVEPRDQAEFAPRRAPDDGPKPERHASTIDESKIDADVQKVVRRLVRAGHEAYLVGGCVRDLLLDRRPKDFDVATSARPEEVRELFRNSRIIGRRFRLVHVLFQGGKVIEVATFRRNPKDETDELARGSELLIRNDNAFGVAHEDAMRRDFTINALFYDEGTRTIIDWVGGMADIERRVVHTIGDPETRFREDPIRMLRALKFAGRLGLAITADVYDAIVYCRDALALAARPRLSEEILRMLRGGAARRTTYLAWETGVLDVLLPELATLLYDDDGHGPGSRVWKLLEYLDRRHAEGVQLDDTVLWTVLLLEPLREACEGAHDRAAAASDLLDPIVERLAVSRRFADAMRRIVAITPRLASGKAGRFARTDLFVSAVDVTLADLYARGLPSGHVERLRGGGTRQDRPRQGADWG